MKTVLLSFGQVENIFRLNLCNKCASYRSVQLRSVEFRNGYGLHIAYAIQIFFIIGSPNIHIYGLNMFCVRIDFTELIQHNTTHSAAQLSPHSFNNISTINGCVERAMVFVHRNAIWMPKTTEIVLVVRTHNVVFALNYYKVVNAIKLGKLNVSLLMQSNVDAM